MWNIALVTTRAGTAVSSFDNFTVDSWSLFEAYINKVDSQNFRLYNLNFLQEFFIDVIVNLLWQGKKALEKKNTVHSSDWGNNISL